MFERCVITKGVKTRCFGVSIRSSFERCVITKGVKTIVAWGSSNPRLRGV